MRAPSERGRVYFVEATVSGWMSISEVLLGLTVATVIAARGPLQKFRSR